MARTTVPAVESGSASEGAAREVRGYGVVCGVTGLLFAGLFAAALVLLQQAPGLADPDAAYAAFYAGGDDVLVTVGMHLVPFAGIAWLWHMTATRSLVEAQPGPPSRLPFGLNMAAGLLFVTMMFAGAATVGAPALVGVFSTVAPPDPETARSLTAVGYGLVFVYGVRAAGMYMMTMTGTLRAPGLIPRWLQILGYVAATFLLVSTTFHPAVLLVFPAWVVLVSVVLLVGALRGREVAP